MVAVAVVDMVMVAVAEEEMVVEVEEMVAEVEERSTGDCMDNLHT